MQVFYRFGHVRVIVFGRNMPYERASVVLVDGSHVRGRRYDDRKRISTFPPLANHFRRTICVQHDRLRSTVLPTGIAAVAQSPRPDCRRQEGRNVVRNGHGKSLDDDQRSVCKDPRTYLELGDAGGGRHRHVYGCERGYCERDDRWSGRLLQRAKIEVVHVPASDRMEAHVDYAGVFRLPTRQRCVRAAVLLGRRAPGLPDPVGRPYHNSVPVRRASRRQHCVHHAAHHRTKIAHGFLERRHGRVPVRHRRLHKGVPRRRNTSFRQRRSYHRIRPVCVLRIVRHAPVAVDAL